MKSQVAWPDSVSGWCFWASFVALVGVIAVSLAAPFVLAAGADGAVDVLWRVVQFTFAGLVATFLLGVTCAQVGKLRGEHRGRWRL